MRAGKRKTKMGGGDMQKQLKQMQAMQREMEQSQAELAEREFTSTAGGGAVEVVINGNKEITKLNIDKDVVDPDDVEMLQDLIIVAVNEGLRQIDEISNNEMGKLTGGLGSLYGILLGEGEVAGVEAEVNVARIGVVHQALGLLEGLNYGRHVMMEAELEAAVSCDLAQLVQAGGEAIPLLVGQNALLVVQNRGVQLALDRTGLLGYVDCGSANVGQVIQLLNELSLYLFVRLVNQERGEPLGSDGQVAGVQHVLEDGLVFRVLVADFAAVETSELHLRDALLEGVLVAEIPHIIIGPADRADAQSYFLRI